MLIGVIGATGVLGRQAIPRLVENGHQVRAIVREPEAAERLRCTGVEVVIGDILASDDLIPALASCDAALHLATAVPRPGQPLNWEMNDRNRYLSAQVCAAEPAPGGPVFLPSLGCSNQKIKADLGWQPLFPSYRSGLA